MSKYLITINLMYRAYTKEWCGFSSEYYWNRTILLCMPCIYIYIYRPTNIFVRIIQNCSLIMFWTLSSETTLQADFIHVMKVSLVGVQNVECCCNCNRRTALYLSASLTGFEWPHLNLALVGVRVRRGSVEGFVNGCLCKISVNIRGWSLRGTAVFVIIKLVY
jgi:hypothetical protein